MVNISRIASVGKRVFSDFSGKNVPFMAAAIAYSAFVSLAPLLILLLLVASVVGGGLETRLVSVAGDALPGPIANVVEQIFAGEAAAASASIVGLVVLIWGTLKIFRGLDTAFSEIYETESSNSLFDQLVDGAVVLAALIVAIVMTVVASAAFAVFSDAIPFLGYFTPLVLLLGLIVAFFPMYYRFPDADLEWKEVLPGAIFGAVGWAVLQSLFQVYLTFKSGGSEGFFGSVIVVITWLYFSGLVLLLGAVINAVTGGHSTGAPGGTGQAAARADVDAERSLDREELATYLRELREELTGQSGESRSVGQTEEIRARRPDGSVEVVEASVQEGDEREWTVTLRWRTTEE